MAQGKKKKKRFEAAGAEEKVDELAPDEDLRVLGRNGEEEGEGEEEVVVV